MSEIINAKKGIILYMYEGYEIPIPRETIWNPNMINENFDETKKKIMNLLKEQKVSLSKTRYLFHCILNEIEDDNPITIY